VTGALWVSSSRDGIGSQNKTVYASSCVSNLQQQARGARRVKALEYIKSKMCYVPLYYKNFYRSINAFWFMLTIP
jgi:hypothetical protein